jgi:hypothetical protein
MKRIGFGPLFLFVFVLSALAPRLASAQCAGVLSPSGSVCIVPSSSGTADNFAAAISGGTMTANQLAEQLAGQVDGLFQTANLASFLHDFQNAQSFSTKGLGVDYASEATRVEVGATLSLAGNVDKAYKPSGSYTDPPISGGGANLSLMAGVGMGLFGFDPLMVFGNWFKGSASIGKLDGSYHNWGLHGQLRLFGPSRKMSALKMLVRWGGIAITSGADYSHLSVSTTKPISSTLNVVPGAPVTVTSVGDLTFKLDQTTWSVPLEVTTSLRLLSLVTVYGGIGMDWQLGGGSEMKIAMAANLSGQFQGAQYQDLGTATITAGGKVKPSAARMRDIVGVQLGIMDLIRLFVQVNVSNSSPMLASVAGGLRLGI